jgi:hypothetical protein
MVRLYGDSDAQEGTGQKARLTGARVEAGWMSMSSSQPHPSPPDTNAQPDCPSHVATRAVKRD